MRRFKFKTDRTVVARIFPPRIVREMRNALKEINAGRPYPPKKQSRNIGKA